MKISRLAFLIIASLWVFSSASFAQVANADFANPTEDDVNVIIDVQANDSGTPPIVTSIVSGPTSGGTAIVLNGDSISYTPPADFCGADTIVYQITDAIGSDIDTVFIDVACVNDRPVAVTDFASAPVGTANIYIDVQANDFDPDGDAFLTTFITAPFSGATAVIIGFDSILYNPISTYCYQDTIIYTICDSEPLCDSDTIFVNLLDIIDPSITCPGNDTLYADASCEVVVPDYTGLAVVSDACDGDPSVTQSPVAGSVLSGQGTYEITLTATDTSGNSASCSFDLVVWDTIAPSAVCQDIDAFLDAGGDVSISAASVDGGSTDGCGIDTLTVDLTDFDCGDVGANIVTLTVTDVNSNVSTCLATVTVQDTVAPTALCNDTILYLDGAGEASLSPGDLDAGSSDACGIATISIGQSTFDCDDIGAIAVTVTVTDQNGNVSSCAANVTVSDSIAPIALCTDTTLYLDGSGLASVSAAELDNGSSDECGIASLVLDLTDFGCSDVGANPVTLTVTDNGGNISICNATVTVADTTAPTALCQDITLYLDASGDGTITAGDVDAGSSDNCGIASTVVDLTTFDCGDVGPNAVVLTVTDVNSNVSTCGATVTVADTIAPNAVCNDTTLILDAGGDVSVTPSGIDDGSTDACGIATISISMPNFDCDDIGVNLVTLTVTDVNGNVGTCEATVTVSDTISPVALCRDTTLYLDASGNASVMAGELNDGSSDECGIDSLFLSQSSFDCSDVGANAVVFTAVDNGGNASICNLTVTVIDTVAPVALCQDVTIYLDGSGDASVDASQVDAGSNDACGLDTTYLDLTDFDCGDVGANPVTLTVEDVNGNISTCSATVTVEDTIAPLALCSDTTLYLDGSGDASVSPAEIDNGSTDNCGVASVSLSQSLFDCDDVGANVVTLTVEDVNGNIATCDATVTVLDTISPVAVCADTTLYLDGSGTASVTPGDIDNGSSDNCDIDTIYLDISSFTCADTGANTVTLTVEDVNGNSTTCQATVTVADTTAPEALCADITIFLDASGDATITAGDVDGGSNDNCGIDTIYVDQTDFDCSDVGDVTVTLTVEDVNGNAATCAATVTVVDSVAPVALCSDTTLYLDASGSASVTPAEIDNGSNDACGIDTLSLDQSSFDCAEVGPNSVTLTVEDVNGNTATCVATVTVLDTISPVALCADTTLYLDGTGTASVTPGGIDNGSSDNCEIDTIYLDVSSFTCSDTGSNTVTLTVEDVNGNTSFCTATVTVLDTIAPIALCMDAVLYLDSLGDVTLTPFDVDGGSSDNCSIDTLTVDVLSFDCSDVGDTASVTLTVTDASGNISTCTALVTVLDTIAPEAICKDTTLFLDASGEASISPSDIDDGSNDACGVSSLGLDRNNFECSDIGVTVVTLSVTDVNGNVGTCTANVTVADSTAPLAICSDTTLYLDGSGTASITADEINNGSTDNCEIDTFYIDITSFTCADSGDNAVTLTVEDVNGNIGTCVATVTVLDTISPVVTCPGGDTLFADINCEGLLPDYTGSVVATDNCDPSPALSQSPVPGTLLTVPGTTTTVTITATDISGNTSECSFDVFFADTTSPTITCLPDDTLFADASCEAVLGDYTGLVTAEDSCDVPVVTQDPVAGSTLAAGTTTVTLTATDASGNTATCAFDVVVLDTLAPTVLCPGADTLYVGDSCELALIDYTALVTVLDNCDGSPTITQTPPAGTVLLLGQDTLVTIVVTDSAGNSDSCSFLVFADFLPLPEDSVYTWVGDVSTEWYDPFNWTPCGVPDSIHVAEVPAGSNFDLVVDTTVRVKDLNIQASGSVTAASGSVIQIFGDYSNSGTVSHDGIVEFAGSGDHELSGDMTGASAFDSLAVNTQGTTTMNDDAETDQLDLVEGPLAINGNELTILSSSTGAITRGNGYVVSEDEASKLTWVISTATGTYEFPFGVPASDTYIPFIFDATSAGTGSGEIGVCTYPTTDQNTPLPTGVTDLDLGNNGANWSTQMLDRYWRVEPSGYSTNPTADVTFTYDDLDRQQAGGNIIAASLQAYRWDGADWIQEGGVSDPGNNQLTKFGQTDFSPWALAEPCLAKFSADTVCFGEMTTFIDSSAGVFYRWDFDTTDNIQNSAVVGNVGHVYPAPGVYVAQLIVGDLGGCADTFNLEVLVRPAPAAPVASNDTICAGETAILIASGSGGTLNWYSDAGRVNLVATGDTFITSELFQTTTFFVEEDNDTANCSSVLTPVTVVVNPKPPHPSVEHALETCSSDLSAAVTVSSDQIGSRIYATVINPDGDTIINFNVPIVQLSTAFNFLLVDEGVYTLIWTVGDGTCFSDPTFTNVTVYPHPDAPEAVNDTICAGEQAFLEAIGEDNVGALIKWYDTPVPNDDPIAVGSWFETPPLFVTTSYYALEVDSNGCESELTEIIAVVNPVPAMPVGEGDTICQGESAVLTATGSGGTLFWFTDPFGSNLVGTGNVYVTPPLSQTTTYYVSEGTPEGCLSASEPVVVIVEEKPKIPSVIADLEGCERQLTAEITVSSSEIGDFLLIFVVNESGDTIGFVADTIEALNTSFTLFPPFGSAGNFTLVWTIFNGQCQSDPVFTYVTIRPKPDAPVVENDTICPGDRAVFTAIGSQDPFSEILWYETLGEDPIFIGNTFETLPLDSTTVFYAVELDSAGCYSRIATVTAVVVPLEAPEAEGDTICAGEQATLTATSTSGGVIHWYGDDQLTDLVFVGNTYTTQPLFVTTSFWVTEVLGDCESESVEVVVVVNETPETPEVSSNSPLCEGDTLELTTTAEGPYAYAWTGPGGFTSSEQNPVILNVSTDQHKGTYTLVVTDTITGCQSEPASVEVDINRTPQTPTLLSNTPVCEGEAIVLNTDEISGAQYVWFLADGTVDTTDVPTYTVTDVGLDDAGEYEVVVLLEGCESPAGSTVVVVNAAPESPVASNNGPVCVGGIAIIQAESFEGGDYFWSGPDGFTSTEQVIIIFDAEPADAGVYSVTVTVDGCESPADSTELVVNPLPVIDSLSSNSPVCEGETLELFAFGDENLVYDWTGPGGFTSMEQNPVIFDVTEANNQGVYTVVATDTAADCSSEMQTIFVDILKKPQSVTADNNGPICEGESAQLTVTTVNGATYVWTGPNGFESNVQNPIIQEVGVEDAGIYTVYIDVEGCFSDTAQTILEVNENPRITAERDTTIVEGSSVQIFAEGGVSYIWSPTDYLTGFDISNPVVVQPPAGENGETIEYVYVVTGFDENGCSGQDTVTITVIANDELNIPDLITPNGDGKNDTWIIGFLKNVDEYTIRIYDRGGMEIFSVENDYANDWGGTWDGKEVPEGTYWYIITTPDKEYRGGITVIR